MKPKLNARTHYTGRFPTLRNDIVEFLLRQTAPVTAFDIAKALVLSKSAPYRPLKELIEMKLVEKNMGIDGAEFILDKEFYEYLKLRDPRRIIG
jgi:DNA-binding transcriptional regulator GbsR (MarR family)